MSTEGLAKRILRSRYNEFRSSGIFGPAQELYKLGRIAWDCFEQEHGERRSLALLLALLFCDRADKQQDMPLDPDMLSGLFRRLDPALNTAIGYINGDSDISIAEVFVKIGDAYVE